MESIGAAAPRWTRARQALGRSRTRSWVALAAAVTVLGAAASWGIAVAEARDDAAHARADFRRTALDIAASVRLAVEKEDGLALAAAALVAADPGATSAEIDRWLTSADAFRRNPELSSVGLAVMVSRAELPAFVAKVRKDPAISPDGTYTLVPPGERPYYCLAAAGASRAGAIRVPAGADLCVTGEGGRAMMQARDTGRLSYVPLELGGTRVLATQAPVFRGGGVPRTLAERRDRFVGSVGLLLDARMVLTRAVAGRAGIAVALNYRSPTLTVAFTSGAVPAGATSQASRLGDGWTIRTSARLPAGGLAHDEDALALLAGGILVSLLVGSLITVLATSRSRAVRLVRARTDQLRHQALHDALTGLPNRALILDRADQLLRRARRQGSQVAAMFIDIDDFKDVNDTLGHAVGDRLLVGVGQRLRTALRDADTIGRLGGDEFVVLIDDATVTAGPDLVAQRLLGVMRQPFTLGGTSLPLQVRISIGIAMGDRPEAGDLLRDADLALYQAKAAGKDRFAVFDPAMQTALSTRMNLDQELRSALADEQFELYYQPIYELEHMDVVGVEALLRWNHPTRGVVQPDAFIPVLERTGMIVEVGRWVLREACRQMSAWRARGAELTVSVNLSARQLDDASIVDDVAAALADSGLPAEALVVEITETVLMRNVTATARHLHALKRLGVAIAIDDFGTGYSSLAYLHQFPVDCLKIDRMFTGALATTPESTALIRTLVQLGHDLGLNTLAEGVETIGEMDVLRAEHVDSAQGFLLARPQDARTVERVLIEPLYPRPRPNVGT